MSIGFNARYLLDILQVQDDLRVKMIFKDHLSPGLFCPDKGDGFLAVDLNGDGVADTWFQDANGDGINDLVVNLGAARDASGNESAESEAVSATVAVSPAVPVILLPTTAGHPLTLEATRADVRGRAEPGAIVSLSRNGNLVRTTTAKPAFDEVRGAQFAEGVTRKVQVAVSRNGDTVTATYAQLASRVAALAGGLRNTLGLGEGARIR